MLSRSATSRSQVGHKLQIFLFTTCRQEKNLHLMADLTDRCNGIGALKREQFVTVTTGRQTGDQRMSRMQRLICTMKTLMSDELMSTLNKHNDSSLAV